jgi:hypothetical protein
LGLAALGVVAGAATFSLGRERAPGVERVLGVVLALCGAITLAGSISMRIQAAPRGGALWANPLAGPLTGLGGLTYGLALLLAGGPGARALAVVGALFMLAGAFFALKKA